MHSVKLSIFFLSTFFLSTVYSIVPDFNRKQVRPRGPSVVTSNSASVSNVASISSGESARYSKCDSKDNDISKKLFTNLSYSRDGVKEISINSFDPATNELVINIPGYISACMKLQPRFSDVFDDGNKQFARLILRNTKDMSDYAGYTMEEKIEDCLKKSELLEDDGTWNEEKVMSNIESMGVVEYRLSGGDIDLSKQLGIVFGSPNESNYVDSSPNITSNNHCYVDESISTKLLSLRDEQTAKDNRIVNLCESLNLEEIQQELESQATLEPYQRSLLNDVLRQAQELFVEEKLEKLEELGKEILETDNYDLIRSLGFEYLEILDDLEEDIINPAKVEMIELAKGLRNAKSTDERRQINSELNKLSQLIGALSNTSQSRIFPQVLDKLLENGQSETANKVALISIKSNEYAKAKRYIDSGSTSSRRRNANDIFRSVDKLIDSEYRKFVSRSEEARVVYEQRTGLSRLSPRVKDELDYVVRLRDQQFDLAVRNIQRELDKCNRNVLGIMVSPISCKNAMENQAEWYREALSEKEAYNQRISQLASKYSFYSGLERQAVQNEFQASGSRDLGNYEHKSNDYLGSYGLYDNYGDSSGSSSVHRLEDRSLIGSNSSTDYQAFFSSPSRVNPYSSFGVQPQSGYSVQPQPSYNFR